MPGRFFSIARASTFPTPKKMENRGTSLLGWSPRRVGEEVLDGVDAI